MNKKILNMIKNKQMKINSIIYKTKRKIKIILKSNNTKIT